MPLPADRNLSSVNERTRQKMREMPGLVDSLVCYIQQEEAGDDKVAKLHWPPETFSNIVTVLSEASRRHSSHSLLWIDPQSKWPWPCGVNVSSELTMQFHQTWTSTHSPGVTAVVPRRVWRILSASWGTSPTSCTPSCQYQSECVWKAHPELQPADTARPLAASLCTTRRKFRYVDCQNTAVRLLLLACVFKDDMKLWPELSVGRVILQAEVS